MKRIDKQITHARAYQDWFPSATDRAYESSRNPYYLDALFELLIRQEGLCAYTEWKLIDSDQIDVLKQSFVNGKAANAKKPETFVDLEHFDPTLKSSRPWHWDNLFAVWDGVNKVKGSKPVDPILKPDDEGYDPYRLLEYSLEHHRFFPNQSLSQGEKQRVAEMLRVLGINYGKVVQERRDYLDEKLKKSELDGLRPIIKQFPTAYAMIIAKQQTQYPDSN